MFEHGRFGETAASGTGTRRHFPAVHVRRLVQIRTVDQSAISQSRHRKYETVFRAVKSRKPADDSSDVDFESDIPAERQRCYNSQPDWKGQQNGIVKHDFYHPTMRTISNSRCRMHRRLPQIPDNQEQ